MIVEPTDEAWTEVIDTNDGYFVGSTIIMLGDAPGDEVISIQVPAVADPVAATDAHWRDLVIESTTQQLSATNLAWPISFSGKFRLVKAAGTANIGAIIRALR